MQTTNIAFLLKECESARRSKSWSALERCSLQVLTLAETVNMPEKSLIETIKNYLSSILGSGEFISDFNMKSLAHFENGVKNLQFFLEKKPHLHNEVRTLERAANEVRLLSLNPTASNQNKIARSLRTLARPDLSIQIGESLLLLSKKNYYVLTTLCAAYCDNYEFDKAIKSAEIALKYNPIDGQSFALNALTRAYTERFKRDGEITDIERALELANQSLERKVDIFSANSYIAAAVASGREDEIESANNILEKVNPATSIVDEEALIAAYEAASTIPDEIMQDYLNSRPLPK